jgi:hypothetical protein
VSEDPRKGKDQKAAGFWNDVRDAWCASLAIVASDEATRSIQALKNRWTILSRETHKFNGVWAQAKEQRKRSGSGKTDADVLTDAKELYLKLEKEAFQHECT